MVAALKVYSVSEVCTSSDQADESCSTERSDVQKKLSTKN